MRDMNLPLFGLGKLNGFTLKIPVSLNNKKAFGIPVVTSCNNSFMSSIDILELHPLIE